ncbi:FecR family protein [Niabella pedocola]|uniref:FecR family protein n=1 Tax=Niabella pedocola TaxID=1752077 RepID=A0ABS8PVW5_9BACT|nr:FecR family protein [Niabella pedocola]MCD2425218.1 FecR family protein [Niabella pedocola]
MSLYEFDFLLEKYISGNCTPEEEQQVLIWYNRLISESSVKLSEAEKNSIEERIWAHLKPAAITEEPRLQEPVSGAARSRRLVWYVAAASVMLAVALGFYMFRGEKPAQQQERIAGLKGVPASYLMAENSGNSLKNITLPDGSVITLQKNSVLFYPEQFTKNTREVYFSGNAFFDIHRDTLRRFVIYAPNDLVTEVLGTSFYILQNTAKHTLNVEVVTGKVSVYKKDKRQAYMRAKKENLVLTPNEKVEYNSEKNRFFTTIVDEPQLLQTAALPVFEFEEVPLEQVLNRLHQAYGVALSVKSDALLKCPFTGNITGMGLYQQLDVVCRVLNASYEINGTNIIISGSGCQ